MGDLKPAFQGELMLAGWKESHNSGAIVSFWLPDSADLDVFKGMTAKKGNTAGQRFMAALVEIHDGELIQRESESTTRGDGRGATTDSGGGGGAADPGAPSKSAPNELANRLHVTGYFRNPKLWTAMEANGLYTQAEHKAYIESLDCFMKSGVDAKQCQGDIVLHHCKSAATPAAGHTTDNPQKPPHWYGVNLCAITHHQNWVHAGFDGATRKDKEWLLEQAVAITADRMKLKIKAWLGIESLRQITQAQLDRFEEAIGL